MTGSEEEEAVHCSQPLEDMSLSHTNSLLPVKADEGVWSRGVTLTRWGKEMCVAIGRGMVRIEPMFR